jgi:hypothetical protein
MIDAAATPQGTIRERRRRAAVRCGSDRLCETNNGGAVAWVRYDREQRVHQPVGLALHPRVSATWQPKISNESHCQADGSLSGHQRSVETRVRPQLHHPPVRSPTNSNKWGVTVNASSLQDAGRSLHHPRTPRSQVVASRMKAAREARAGRASLRRRELGRGAAPSPASDSSDVPRQHADTQTPGLQRAGPENNVVDDHPTRDDRSGSARAFAPEPACLAGEGLRGTASNLRRAMRSLWADSLLVTWFLRPRSISRFS